MIELARENFLVSFLYLRGKNMKKAFLTTFLAVCVIGTFVGCGEKNQVQDNKSSVEEIATNDIEENDNSEEEKIEITKELEENRRDFCLSYIYFFVSHY